MPTALYFGSFNPLHIGHMAIANYAIEFCGADEAVFIATPQSPFKESDKSLLANYGERIRSLRASVAKSGLKITVSDIESGMNPPYYTINTLKRISSLHPEKEFVIMMGADNIASFNRWHRYEEILENYGIWVYPRLGYHMQASIQELIRAAAGVHDQYGNVPFMKTEGSHMVTYSAKGIKGISIIDAPVIEVSSTMMRNAEAEGKNMSAFKYV